MKIHLFIKTFLIIILATYIFAKEECNIEIITNDPNKNKDLKLKCKNNDKYCKNVIISCNPNLNRSFYKITDTQCTLEIFYYQYEEFKKTLNKNNFICDENKTDSKSCYEKCIENTNNGSDDKINCCLNCNHSSYC